MQEYALFGQIPSESHRQVLQQLAGLARMQPQAVEELHLIFRAKPPPGLADVQKSSGGGSQGVVPPEVQKTRAMLNASLYYVQLVGTARITSQQSSKATANDDVGGTADVFMANGDAQGDPRAAKQMDWTLEFRDTPDPGKQPVSSRVSFNTSLVEGNVVKFINDFGFEYVSRYVINGHKVFDQDTTLFLHRVMQVTKSGSTDSDEFVDMPKAGDLVPLDKSDSYILSATIQTIDGSNVKLRERAIQQLLAMKETMKEALTLAPADRLALDTKVPIAVGQRR